jgi:hypothetical protein
MVRRRDAGLIARTVYLLDVTDTCPLNVVLKARPVEVLALDLGDDATDDAEA